MFTQFAMENLQTTGYRTGVRESEIPQIKQWLADGKTPAEISQKLLVVESAISGYAGVAPTEDEQAAAEAARNANSRAYYKAETKLVPPDLAPGQLLDPATGVARLAPLPKPAAPAAKPAAAPAKPK